MKLTRHTCAVPECDGYHCEHGDTWRLELTTREAEQLCLEVDTLQLEARVRGHLLDWLRNQLVDEHHLIPAPYPGHHDTWPTWQK